MKEVAEVFHPLVMEEKTKMAKDLETSGVAQNVEIHVLPWNVSLCQFCIFMDPVILRPFNGISMRLHII